MTLPDRMRAAISANHTAVEATPFATAMVSGRMTREHYAAALRGLHRLHAALESALATSQQCAAVAAVYAPDRMNRADLIVGDLEALGFALDADEPNPEADELAAKFTRWAASAPHALLGALYVIEGSRMGSMVLARTLGPALGAGRGPGTGLDYHLDGIATRPQDWQRFRGTLAALPLSAAEQDAASAAADETMQGLVAIYAALPAPELALAN